MSFTPSDASKFARLAIAAMSNKSTPAQMRKASGEAAAATLPPGHTLDSHYVWLVTRAATLRDPVSIEQRSNVASLAYAVGMDLLLNVTAFAARKDLEAASANYKTRAAAAAPQVKTHVANPHAFDRFSRRRDLNDADDIAAHEVEPDDLPLPYTQRQALARIANDSDESDEIERALAPP